MLLFSSLCCLSSCVGGLWLLLSCGYQCYVCGSLQLFLCFSENTICYSVFRANICYFIVIDFPLLIVVYDDVVVVVVTLVVWF